MSDDIKQTGGTGWLIEHWRRNPSTTYLCSDEHSVLFWSPNVQLAKVFPNESEAIKYRDAFSSRATVHEHIWCSPDQGSGKQS